MAINGHKIGPIWYIFDLQKAYMATNHSEVMKYGKPILSDKILGLMCLLQIENISNWSDFMSIHSNLYLKSRLGPEFWPWICLPRPDIISAGIGLPCFLHPEWFLAIYAFYRSKKYWIGLIFWQFIPKIRAGARIFTRGHPFQTQHFVYNYWFAMFQDSWVVSSHINLLQIEKISKWSDCTAIHT